MKHVGIALGLAMAVAPLGCRRVEPTPVVCYPVYPCRPCPQTYTNPCPQPYVQSTPARPCAPATTVPALPAR